MTNRSSRQVFVLETGCYEARDVAGVYATPEAAMAAWQPKPAGQTMVVHGREYGPELAGKPWSYEWSGPDKDGLYGFGADWDDAATITPYEVEG